MYGDARDKRSDSRGGSLNKPVYGVDDDPNVLLFLAGIELVEFLNLAFQFRDEFPQLRVVFVQVMIDSDQHNVFIRKFLGCCCTPVSCTNILVQR